MMNIYFGKEGGPHIAVSLTIHPDLPDLTLQTGGARSFLLATGHQTAMYHRLNSYCDDVSNVRTTNWSNHLQNRAFLIEDLKRESSMSKNIKQILKPTKQHRDEIRPDIFIVYFRSPLCVGFSQIHLLETVKSIWKAGGYVYIQTLGILLREGDNLDVVINDMLREKKNSEMRRYRKKIGNPE